MKTVKGNVIIRRLINPTNTSRCACHHLSCAFGNVHHTTTFYPPLPIQSIPVQMYQKFKPIFDAFWYSFVPKFKCWLCNLNTVTGNYDSSLVLC